ncbi:MAG: hypothetical protein LBO70_00050, partial [Clostridiales Family XIII bacterium]|nr:hypothetical protein [Clostridiales Family XIII bacterium]
GHGNALRYIKERRGDGAIQWLLPYHILPDSIIPEILYTVTGVTAMQNTKHEFTVRLTSAYRHDIIINVQWLWEIGGKSV